MRSILDNDQYKFTMQQAIMQCFPRAEVKYKFIMRTEESFPKDFGFDLKSWVSSWVQFGLNSSQHYWLKENCPFLTPTYLDFLKGYRFNPHEVEICQNGDKVSIDICGPWYRTVLWEVPLLAAISELYFKKSPVKCWNQNLCDFQVNSKRSLIRENKLSIIDFGTRRRYSFDNQLRVVQKMEDGLVGTSNMHIAERLRRKPMGTHAHEWFMYHGVKYGYPAANYLALQHWVDVYHGSLGIALTDTYTSDVFYRSFGMMHSKLFDGVRHDSGMIEPFIKKTIAHYESQRIDPTTKTIVFSNNLKVSDAVNIQEMCNRYGIRASFGIGTSLTNDVGVEPLNMVIKLSDVLINKQWVPAVKLSDDTGKYTGDPNEIRRCKESLRLC